MSIDQVKSWAKVNGKVGEQFDWYDVIYEIVSADKDQTWVLLDLFTLREFIIH